MTAMDVALRMIEAGVIEVRPDGNVWKLRNLNPTPLSEPRRVERRMPNGYLSVKVCTDNRQFSVLAHRLVWTVLRGPIPTDMEINHKDGCPTNNHPDNLEVVTGGENLRHSFRTLGRDLPRTIPKAILADIAPRACELRGQGMSFAAIARTLGVSQTSAFRATRL